MSHSVPSVGALSVEIFILVVEVLALPPVPTSIPYNPFLDRDASWTEEEEPRFRKAWATERRDILYLSLESRGLRDLCEPYLWRSVAFQTPKTLSRLVLVLTLNPHLRNHVRAMFWLKSTSSI